MLEKKLKIKNALENDKPIPNELRKEADELKNQLANDDENTLVQRTHIDDESEEAKYKGNKSTILDLTYQKYRSKNNDYYKSQPIFETYAIPKSKNSVR